MRERRRYHADSAHRLDTDLWGELGNAGAGVVGGRGEPGRPLRVAMFASEFPALSETFVLNQVTGLLDLGHDVTVFANGPRGEATTHADIARYRLQDRVRYRSMPKARGARLWRAPGLLAGSGRHRLAALLRALDASSYGRDALSLNMFYWCAALADEAPFDVIHCHFGLVGRAVAYLREIGAIRGRLVVAFHGVDVSACLDADPGLYCHLFAHADLALPISDRWRDRLIDHGCDPARIHVHRMGIDLARFPFRPRTRTATCPLRVLTVGRLVEKKGHEYALRAVAALAAQQVPVSYTVAGDGPLAASLATLARELKIGHQVDFLGAQPQEEVARLMGEHDVLLAPSVTGAGGDQEGIPVTLMEAMASGLPVVSSVHSGIPELVEHGRSGFLAPERDVAGLAAALAALWRDPEAGRRLAFAARGAVEERHDIRALNRRLVAHYRAVMDVDNPADGR
jgi:colanic acid/amylovoran biosynthesis glycosyltransferase